MNNKLGSLVLFSLAITACVGEAQPDNHHIGDCADGKCDDVDQTCNDPGYNNGTCDTQLSCGVPDIDCFVTFDDDAKAATWFSSFETMLAAAEGRAPRKILPSTDPHFARARSMVDRGWAAFRTHRPVGLLGNARPAVVVVEDETVNAFVVPDIASDRSGFAIMVHTGLLDAPGISDDGALGLMMHELQHAVGLHVIGNQSELMRRFYLAANGEPIGNAMTDNPRARTPGVAWLGRAQEIGPYSNAELGGLSLDGELHQIFAQGLREARAFQEPGCEAAIQTYSSLTSDIGASIDAIDGRITQPLSLIAPRVESALDGLDYTCFWNYYSTVGEVLAKMANIGEEEAIQKFPAEERDLVEAVPFFEGITQLIANRRASMRAAEGDFFNSTTKSWSRLRYFSHEEDADDVSVAVLAAAGLDPVGIQEFLFAAMDDNSRERCAQILDEGDVPGYGVNLGDPHHATCWRVAHVRQVANGSSPRLAPAQPVVHATRVPLVEKSLATRVMH